jgi:ATP-binding cassette subfamily B protein
MKNKPLSVLKRNWHVLKFGFKISPLFSLCLLAKYLISGLLPFVALYCSNLIIDKLLSSSPLNEIMVVVYYLISIELVGGVLLAVISVFIQSIGSAFRVKLSQKIAQKTFSLSYGQVEDHKTMRLIEMASEGCNGSGDITSFLNEAGILVQNISSFVYSIILVSSLFVFQGTSTSSFAAFLAGPSPLLIILSEIVLFSFVGVLTMKKNNALSYKAMMDNIDGNRKFAYFYSVSLNYNVGKDIRLFHMQPMIEKMEMNPKYTANGTWNSYAWNSIKLSSVTAILNAILLLTSYLFIGFKASYGQISIGSVVADVGAISLLSTNVVSFLSCQADMSLCSEYLYNYFTYLGLPLDVNYGKEKLDCSKPVNIRFKDVYFTYPGQDEPTLKGLNLEIKAGERLALVGLNGAGKSTLVKLLCRFYNPDRGEIYLNDLPLSSYDEDSIYHLYAVVFQDFKLFSYSIRENIYCGKTGDEEKLIDCLKRAGIYERVMSFPDGLDTIIYNKNDENGVEISGGEAQKLAIARALYKDSPIVVLDEPTSALDPKSEAEIYDKFATLVKGKTAIFISHRMSSTRDSDEIAVIDDGRVNELGNHKTLLKKNGLYKKMWDAQAQYYR